MRRLRQFIVIGGAFLALGGMPALVAAADPGAKMVETGGRYAFSPTSISITAGSTITWTNTTDAPHTVTADGGQFSSPTVAAGTAFSHTFSTPGTYAYHCAIHPYMTATVFVSAATTSGGGPAITPPPTDAVDFGTSDQATRFGPLGLMLAGGVLFIGASILWLRRRSA